MFLFLYTKIKIVFILVCTLYMVIIQDTKKNINVIKIKYTKSFELKSNLNIAAVELCRSLNINSITTFAT